MSKQLSLGDSFDVQPVTIREIPVSDRPRERLQHVGASALSTTELLSIVLINGTKKANAIELARSLLVKYDDLPSLSRATVGELVLHDGVGISKAVRLKASFQLGQRIYSAVPEDRFTVTSPDQAASYLMVEMMNLEQEHLRTLLLNTRNQMISCPTIYIGSLNTSVLRVGEVFRAAIKVNAAAIIIAHNHPSGDPAPSPEDINVTRQLVKAGKLLDIEVLDHIIIGHKRYVSLKERKLGFD